MTMVPVLETERLRMRAWREEDLAPFAAFCSDEATVRYLGGPGDAADAWRRMALQAGHWSLLGYGAWALEEKASGQWVGYCGLWNPHGWPEREVMWGLGPTARGRGYATEAARQARAFAYSELGWTTLISCIAPDNVASQQVALRLGATLERSFELKGSRMARTVGLYRHPGATPSKP